MKKNFLTFALLMAAFASCSHEELPVQNADLQPMPAPVLSRSITETSATIVGYAADGSLVFKHDLRQTDADANVWEWYPATDVPTHTHLENVQDLVCLVPAQTVNGSTFSISPEADELLMWDKMSASELHTDKKFYFDDVRHRLSKICVEVDHLQKGDYLYAYYHTGGTFDCLTGEFTKLNSRKATRIRPEENADGLYTTTFSVVPQTFEEGDDLLRYRDEMSGGYRNYYHEMPDTTITLLANRMLHIHTQWNTDWRKGSYNSYTVYVSGVELAQNAMTIYTGETATLTATVKPSDADNQNVSWTSSNPTVATVDANGNVSAVSPGTATITVTTKDGNYTATCEVTVQQRVTAVTLDKTEVTLKVNETVTLTATVAPDNASNKSVTWTSSDSSKATVDSNGNVTAVKAGTVTITATTNDSNIKATCLVTVSADVEDATKKEEGMGNSGSGTGNTGGSGTGNTGSGNIGWGTSGNGNS